MSGHSKWHSIKHKKAATDAKRGKAFSRINKEITIAARIGGGDPGFNPRLRLALAKAKAENVPKDNIDRAIKRGTGEIQGADYEEVSYEGYGPGGVALMVETLTDNINRTVADLRAMFSKAGGSLGQNGSVAFLFERKGRFEIPVDRADEMTLFELVAEAGADDLVNEEDIFVVEGMQRGRLSPGFDGGKFSPVMDSPTHLFHAWVADKVEAYRHPESHAAE